MTTAVFLDRDGIINRRPAEHDYVKNWKKFKILLSVPRAIKLLNNLNWKVIVVTNQRGVARSFMTRETIDGIHEKVNKVLEQFGAHIDRFYWCGHDINDNCECRKPKIGMITQAVNDFSIDLARSYFIGDDETDRLCAVNAGIKPIIIPTNGSLLRTVKSIIRNRE